MTNKSEGQEVAVLLDTEQNLIGEGIPFERTRRITGYLVGTLERFNNAKRAEERARVKHTGNVNEGV